MSNTNKTQQMPCCDVADIFDVLSHEIRMKIIQLLYENIEMSYSEILDALKIDSGLLNFHLRKIKRFIRPTNSGTYVLSECGKIAHEIVCDANKKLHLIGLKEERLKEIGKPLSLDIISRRILAFALDALILFLSTGLFLDKNFWLLASGDLSPIINATYETVASYSTMFLASYGYFTVLDAYKGQTLGKHVFRIRCVKVSGEKIKILDSAVRNIGKAFLLPLDMILGLLFYARYGYLRFFDYYTKCTVEKIMPEIKRVEEVKAEIAEPEIAKVAEAQEKPM
ncbi:MAG: RDD family protein [Euryarchaeota archaeon]|nr:RDD family protein [Euryarchaeota archaeon]